MAEHEKGIISPLAIVWRAKNLTGTVATAETILARELAFPQPLTNQLIEVYNKKVLFHCETYCVVT